MKIRRWIRRVALAVAAILLVVVVASIALLTVDLGPRLRERAEREGSKLISRTMHIGRLGIRLRSGNFVIEDFLIEGLTPRDHPLFTAKRIEVSLHWWTFFRTREVLIQSIDMSDWDMQVEMKDGKDNFIDTKKFKSSDPNKKRSFTVTLARVDAVRGRFTYLDHGTWSTVSPNLTVHVDHDSGEYRGRASFTGGVVKIKSYEPMRDDMRCAFKLDGAKVHLNWIDLTTDGSHSVVSGDVDFGNWPEMLFRVRTDMVDFPRMRQIFFATEKFRVGGEGKFNGTFHLYPHGGRDLQGSFTSPLLTINGMRFPDLTGDLRWLPDRFTITSGAAKFHGGLGHFTYSMAPLGAPQPAVARFDTSFADVDLGSFTDSLKLQGLRIAGRASGRNLLEWPIGRFSEHRGAGEIAVHPPSGAVLYSRTSAPLPQAKPGTPPDANVGVVPDLGHVPMAGSLRYEFGPEWVEVGASSVATPSTYVEFSGRTAYGERSSFDFYARSGDWQESDKLLAAVITAFGSKSRTIPVGGYGEFTGRMVNSFRRPRIEGSFTGEQVRAFDVIWGTARGQVVVDDGYVDVTKGVATKGGTTELRAEGRFSLSTPRDDGGEEINTVVSIKDWPILDLRHAFDLDAYPIDGLLGGEYHVYGAYRRPYGYGKMLVTGGSAYAEPFERGSGSLRLEGVGVRLGEIQISKGGGTISGSAYVSWDGKYSFNADGRRIPIEQMAALKFPSAPPLSGVLSFDHATGAGAFAAPSYRIEGIKIADLYIGDEGIGQVTGNLGVENQVMAFDVLAASTRLTVQGAGRVAIAPGADADMTFGVVDTSLDPYLRTLQPSTMSPFTSPFTRAIVSGRVHVRGSLTDPTRLLAEATVEQLDMRLWDYTVTNPKGVPLRLAFENNVIHLGDPPSARPAGASAASRPPIMLVGQDTRLSLWGDVNLGGEPYMQSAGALVPARALRVHADGDANLGILQGFFPDIRSSGNARLTADVEGPFDGGVAFNGKATIANGRIRYYSLPHSIDAINGPITFTAGAVWLGDPKDPRNELTAQIGGGAVTFGGRMELVNGFTPAQWAVSASASNVHLRYPEGFNSVVDGDLSLSGPYGSPTLHGTITVKSAVYSKQIDTTVLALAAAGGGGPGAAAAASAPTAFPLRFDLTILAPSTLRLENNLARDLVARANLTLQGTYDRPLLLGDAEIERGYLLFEGKRYTVTHGTFGFNNPTRIDPFFDFETETRVRVPGQSYYVDLHVVGTIKKFDIQLTSDPPLGQPEIAMLLLGDIRSNPEDIRNAELMALQRSNAAATDVLRTRIEQMILSSGTSAVSKAVERTLPGSTFTLTPSLFDEYQRLNPSATVTIGQQISNRAYLTVSRSLYAPQEDIIYLLEYDQSDRISWVVSRNEDRTYAIDVRVRRTF